MVNTKKIKKSFFNEDNISRNILPYFNIYDAEVCLIKFKNTDKQRAVYKVKFNNNTYCLKKIYFSKNELLYVYSAIEWLHEFKINVPRLIPAADGMRYLNYNDIIFILTPWVDGEKCSFDNYEHVIKSSIELAKLHRCTKNFKPIEGSALRNGCSSLFQSFSKHFNELILFSKHATDQKDSFSKKFLEYIDINIKLCRYSIKYSSQINTDSLSQSLCHGDYVNKNIIFSNNDIWIIDFDKCRNDYCAHDLSYFMRRLLKREKTDWNINLAIDVLKSYDSHKKLTEADLKYIVSYLAFPQKFWKTCHDYYRESKSYDKAAFSKMLLKSNINTDKHLDFIIKISKLLNDVDWNLSLINKTL